MSSASRLRGAASEGGQMQRSEVTPIERFRYQLSLMRKEVAAMIGAEKVDKFIRVTLTAVQRNQEMLDPRARKSLFIACLEAAQDGLLPDGSEAVFNVYNTKIKAAEGVREEWVPTVQYLPMAYGLVQKMYEIPGVTFVDAVAVYERDQFEYERGDEPRIVHVPYQGEEDPGKIVAAYVVVKSKDRETKREVMFRRDIEKVRKKSKSPNGLMWKEGEDGFYDQGAIKSVIHRVFKQLPQAERLQRVLAHDNAAAGLAGVETVIPPDETGLNLAAIADATVATTMRDAPLAGAGLPPRTAETIDSSTGEIVKDAATGATAPAPATGATAAAPKDEPPPPKPGDPGTPEMKTKIMGQFERSEALDVLEIVMDEVRFFKWSEADLKDLTTKYNEVKYRLSKGG